jgi:hypothetical protein
MALDDELLAKLVAAGVGAAGTSLFVSSRAAIPTGTGPYLSVIETGGLAPARMQNSVTQRPGAQLIGRAKDYVDARTIVVAAYNALGGATGLHNVTLSGTKYVRIVPMQEPADLGGLDNAARALVAFNVAIEKAVS